jgi:hypothetical protein
MDVCSSGSSAANFSQRVGANREIPLANAPSSEKTNMLSFMMGEKARLSIVGPYACSSGATLVVDLLEKWQRHRLDEDRNWSILPGTTLRNGMLQELEKLATL